MSKTKNTAITASDAVDAPVCDKNSKIIALLNLLYQIFSVIARLFYDCRNVFTSVAYIIPPNIADRQISTKFGIYIKLKTPARCNMIIETFMTFLSRIFFFTSFVNTNGSFPKPLTAEEERMYFEKYKNGDTEAYDILVRHNLRLVAHIVKKYNNAGEADDLISVGSIGLIKGIFDLHFPDD